MYIWLVKQRKSGNFLKICILAFHYNIPEYISGDSVIKKGHFMKFDI